MFTIPFTQHQGYRPKSIIGNATSDAPVEFDLIMADGPNQARVKSLIQATTGLTLDLAQWTPEIQRNVVSALAQCSELFIGTVGAIRNFKAPAQLCRMVAIKVDDKAKDDDEIPIDTGVKFSRVATYIPILALELAFEISSITNKAQIDPRFFELPPGSPASVASPNGTARAVRPRSKRPGTVASPGQTANRPSST